MLKDKAKFPVMRLGNAITPQTLKPGSLWFSTVVWEFEVFHLVLSLLFSYEMGAGIRNILLLAFLEFLVVGMNKWFLWALMTSRSYVPTVSLLENLQVIMTVRLLKERIIFQIWVWSWIPVNISLIFRNKKWKLD